MHSNRGLIDDETRQAAEQFAASSQARQTKEVRQRNIPWENLKSGHLITEDEYQIIKKFDRANDNEKEKLLEENGRNHIEVFLGILKNNKNEEILEYILTMMDDALSTNKSVASWLHAVTGNNDSHYKLLIQIATNVSTKTYVINKSITVLKELLVTGEPLEPQLCTHFFTWLVSKVKACENETIQAVIQCLMTVLRVDMYRLAFYSTLGAIDGLVDMMTRRSSNFQTQYQVVFCFWLLTYNEEIATTIATRHHITRTVATVLRRANKEKVIRVCLATLKNLLEKPESTAINGRLMITNEILSHLRILKEKNWKDEDTINDLEFVEAELDLIVNDMSSWDEYCTEVRSGELSWSAVHKSEGFWRECYMKFNENEHEMLRLLNACLESKQAIVLAVAIHDIGEYIKHYHHGRKYIEELGGKGKIIALMEHENSAVRYEALLAVQKLMVTNWTFLQTSKSS